MANSDWRLGMRAAVREKIFEPASLATGAKSVRVHLLDISTGGAKIHCPTPLSIGAAVVLAWAGEERVAYVAWSVGPRCGVRFRIPLTADRIETLIRPLVTATVQHAPPATARPAPRVLVQSLS